MSAFINKPVSGWIHADSLISKEGATYAVRVRSHVILFVSLKNTYILVFFLNLQYVGCLEVKASMKTLDFKTRTSVAK